MNKLFVLLSLVSGFAAAHGQSPVTYGGKENLEEALVIEDVTHVPITMSLSPNEEKFAYDFWVDGNIVLTLDRVRDQQKVHVPVLMTKPNVPVRHKICSSNRVDESATGAQFRIKVCTTAELIWIQGEK